MFFWEGLATHNMEVILPYRTLVRRSTRDIKRIMDHLDFPASHSAILVSAFVIQWVLNHGLHNCHAHRRRKLHFTTLSG